MLTRRQERERANMPLDQGLATAVAGLSERLSSISTAFNESQEDNFRDLPDDERKLRLEELDDSWRMCEKIYYDMCAKYTADQRNELEFFTEKRFEHFKKVYRDTKLAFRRCSQNDRFMRRSESSSGIASDLTSDHSDFSVGMLRRIDPPTFDGDRAQWLSFRESFASMVVNTNLSKVDKFNYLKRSLKETAQDIVKGLPASNQSFDVAWSELNDRYDNPRILKQCHVDALLSISAVTQKSNDGSEYERVLNEIHANLMSLKGLGVDYEAWGELLLGVVKTKFDNSWLEDWEKCVSAKLYDATYKGFKNFVLCRIESRTARTVKPDHSMPQNKKPKKFTKVHTASHVAKCPECSGEHFLFKCEKIINLPEKERFDAIRKHRICFNCLHPGHVISTCPSKYTCKICKGKHHTLLHRTNFESRKRHFDSSSEKSPVPFKSAKTDNQNKDT